MVEDQYSLKFEEIYRASLHHKSKPISDIVGCIIGIKSVW